MSGIQTIKHNRAYSMFDRCEFPIERMVLQDLWYYNMPDKYNGLSNEYENETFVVRPYSWVDETGLNDWHFWHKPSGLKLAWYKYPLRGCYSNIVDLNPKDFRDVLMDCKNSFPENCEGKVTIRDETGSKWWED